MSKRKINPITGLEKRTLEEILLTPEEDFEENYRQMKQEKILTRLEAINQRIKKIEKEHKELSELICREVSN